MHRGVSACFDAAISRNYLPIRESKHYSREPPARDQTGGTVMRASGAPDNVNTRSIEQFIFSPRDVCALKKMIQAHLPRSFI
jgi:hypothetical protein